MIFDLIASIFKPAVDLVDSLHTSEEEKLQAKTKLQAIQNEMTLKVLEYEKQLLKSQSEIITAEAKGASWLQRNWRPCTMLCFLLLVMCDSFGLLPNPLAADAWKLIQLGLGGYVVGRSSEKAIKEYKKGK